MPKKSSVPLSNHPEERKNITRRREKKPKCWATERRERKRERERERERE